MFKFIELLQSNNKLVLINLARFIKEASQTCNEVLLTIHRNQHNMLYVGFWFWVSDNTNININSLIMIRII